MGDELEALVAEQLGAGGSLSRLVPGFAVRPEQVEMSRAVAASAQRLDASGALLWLAAGLLLSLLLAPLAAAAAIRIALT